jgi:hypothetical protein
MAHARLLEKHPLLRSLMIDPSDFPFQLRSLYVQGEISAGIGNDNKELSGSIGLGIPPAILSNPLRLSIIFIVASMVA